MSFQVGSPVTDELLTTKELAGYLKIPVETLYQWRQRGEGPAGLRIGRYLRYRRSEVDRWLEGRGTSARTA